MTWDFKFDESGDIVINELNRLEVVSGSEKVKQHIRHILKCVKGSDYFNPNFGVDWLKIVQSKFNQKLIEHEIRKALSTYDKIKSIDKIEISDPDSNRNVKIKLYLTLDEGKLETEVVV
ncbi:hypothetical protein DRP05_15255 [Archaeoglobales archaeon]|nr:MAG: hypothetical protein DRP05_15255 [Archaeoglobales archaeon]